MLLRGALVLALVFTATTHANAQLIITAPAAPGGGWDQTARVMQRVLAEVEPGINVQVDNIPGAAGTIGLARFVQSERGNPQALLVTGLVMVSGVITSASPVSLSAATPIARLTGETEVIVVPAGSPHHTINDLIAAFKQDPGAISWGGGSAGGTDDLLVRLLAEQVGLTASSVNFIAFSGGGAALAAALGGQVTAAVSGYGEFAGPIAAGQLRPLAISAAERIAGINAPTLRESGVALDLANWRAIVGPPGLSDAEREALTARVTRMAQSDAWKEALTRNGWDDLFLAGAGFRQFLLAEQARVEAVLQRLAMADAAAPARMSMSITPTTVPTATVALFGILALTLAATRRRANPREIPPGSGMKSATWLALALLAQPLLMPRAGFIIAATVTFVSTASAWRGQRPAIATLARDVAVGITFATVVYVLFTSGLGVALPWFPLLTFHFSLFTS